MEVSIEELKGRIADSKWALNSGTLRFFGEWFGRPMDNFHVPKRVYFEADRLCILFEDDYLVTIVQPRSIFLDDLSFSVGLAKSVVFEYEYNGGNDATERRFVEYVHMDSCILKKTGIVGGSETSTTKLAGSHKAFEIVR